MVGSPTAVQRIRLAFDGDSGSANPPVAILNQLDEGSTPQPDLATPKAATPPFLWLDADAQFEVAWFFAGALEDISNLVSATLLLFDLNALDGAPVLSQTTTTFNTSLAIANWQDKSAQQALFYFPSIALSFPITGNNQLFQAMLVATTSSGQIIMRGPAYITVQSSGGGTPTSSSGVATILKDGDTVVVPHTGMTATGLIYPFWIGTPQSTIGAVAGVNQFTIQAGGPMGANTQVGWYIARLS